MTISRPSDLGSSETTREAPLNLNKFFCFNAYFTHFKPIKSINIQFFEWFIGSSEEDDFFIILKEQNDFIINQKDLKIFYKIKSYFGFWSNF